MRKLLIRIWVFICYFIGKKSEIKDIGFKDLVLGKVVLDIHRKRVCSNQIWVSLFHLKPIHAIDRENSIKVTHDRIDILKGKKTALLDEHRVSKKSLNNYLPSVSGIKVVQESESSFIAFEGNGRVVALQEVFDVEDPLLFEVECYSFDKPNKIIKRVNRLRRLNGLL